MNLKERYQLVQEEIAAAATSCGRNPKEIKLVAVSKTQSIGAIQELFALGCTRFGENRVQEALPKIEALDAQVEWHFIGTLQKNKVSKVIGNFELIHSVDSLDLAEKISDAGRKEGVTTNILLEVNVSGEASKHGFNEVELKSALDRLAQLPSVKLCGLMTMAPFSAPEGEIRACFSGLRKLKEEIAAQLGKTHPFDQLSMGMSHDFTIAIQEGATIVRIGTKIFQAV